MSLLQQNSEKMDDAASGEEFTKGSSNVLLPSITAAVLVTIAVFVYVRLGEKPPMATGEVTHVVSHLMHRETAGVDASGAPTPKEVFDQVLVFAHVKLHNQSKQPLFLHQILADATLKDGLLSSYAASAIDYERIFASYPDLAPLHGKPLSYELTLEAGQTVEGDVVSAFRISKPDWDGRKDLAFTFAFRYQPNLKVIPTGAVTDR
ncbi:MAG TPA: hypothetical protein VGG85_13820 [Terracidiphilus sp.]|jgi:hypothetical protein